MNVQSDLSSVLNSKKRSSFSSLFDRYMSKKNRRGKKNIFGTLFLILLILGLISVGILVNLRSDLRQQAATSTYDECIYWSGGTCPNGFADSNNCYPACGTNGACCKPQTKVTPSVTPTPGDKKDNTNCPNYNSQTGKCGAFKY